MAEPTDPKETKQLTTGEDGSKSLVTRVKEKLPRSDTPPAAIVTPVPLTRR